MQKINTTLFDLHTVYTSISHGGVSLMLDGLLEVKSELDETKDYLLGLERLKEDELELYQHLVNQLAYINKNVKTLGDVILCHKTKTFQLRTIMGKLTEICLN